MKARSWAFFLGIVLSFFISTAVAYELATHGAITWNASQRSSLTGQLLKELGIYSDILRKPDEPFGAVYYDVSGTAVHSRESHTFEDAIIAGIGVFPRSLPGWLMRGAIREDDVLNPDNGQPLDDPYNTGDVVFDNRVLNHFYDPVYNRALTRFIPLSWAGVKKAPDWAIGTNANAFTSPNTQEEGRRNHFTVFDAREAMYRALTGKTKDGKDAGPGGIEAKDEHRKAYWATLFRALGDIVHLIQDMGQPQHTRNLSGCRDCARTIT